MSMADADAGNGMDEKATSLSSIVDDGQQQVVAEGTDDKNRLTRHPRWTKLETLVLVEGKKIAENQGRKRPGLLLGTGGPESKWDYISSYCKNHGVNRGAVQCRKRWSNLICDFKKIKVWESRQKEEGESFWMMRSDVRRNRKLPGFFDRELYSVLDGKAARVVITSPMVVPIIVADGEKNGETETCETENEDDGEAEEVHDGGGSHDKGKQTPVYGSEGLEEPEELHKIPEVDNAKGTPEEIISTAEPISASVTDKGKQTCMLWRRSIFQGVKRQRLSSDGYDKGMNLNHQLIKVMEKNTFILNAQLETQNINSQLEREQQKGQSDKLVSALSKISDALARIADKL